MAVRGRQSARMGWYLMRRRLAKRGKFPLIVGLWPLIHPEIHVIADELLKRKKFVYLCTNALLLEKKLENFKPSPYFSWAVHMDGLQERHDASVEREGVFDKAVAAIKAAKSAGFRV